MTTVTTEAPFSVAAALDEHVLALEEERLPDGLYHPSSFWTRCDRKVIYELRGVEKTNPHDNVSSRRFRIGHIFHAFIQEALLSSPDLLEFYPEFSIGGQPGDRETGHGDGLGKLADGTWFVLEAKSARATSFKFGLKPEHGKQGATYAVHARTRGVWVDDANAEGGKRFIPPLGDKLVGVLVFYLEKEDMKSKEFWLPYDVQWEQDLVDRIAELDEYFNDPASLPARLPLTKKGGKLVKSWECGYCPFLDRCWKQDGGKVKPGAKAELPAAFEW